MCCLKDLPPSKSGVYIYHTTPRDLDNIRDITDALGKSGFQGAVIALYPGEELTGLDDYALTQLGLQRIPPKEGRHASH